MMLRRPMLAVGALFVVASGSIGAWPGSSPSWVFDLPMGGTNCSFLDPTTIPVRYDVSFAGEIQPLLDTTCTTCHINGSTNGFNVSASNARLSLIGATETGAPFTFNNSIFRVRPGRPLESGLFLKLNCEIPPVPYGVRMPPSGASAELQALVHDWIASGALMPTSPNADRIAVGTFEVITRPAPLP
jgi:hypothetical protein